jgi:integrase
LIGENPVGILSETRQWVRLSRRRTALRAHDLEAWFKAVLALDDEAAIAKAYLQFLLLHGLRRGEAARLRWKDVDLKGETFTLVDPKNHVDHELPLSDYTTALLEALPRDGEFVFPGPGKLGHLIDPGRQVERVVKASGVAFVLHDLRRTFATIAESLDISAYAVKRLLNHKMASDVTAGYIVSDVERLRAPTQRVTDFILKAAGIRPTPQPLAIAA